MVATRYQAIPELRNDCAVVALQAIEDLTGLYDHVGIILSHTLKGGVRNTKVTQWLLDHGYKPARVPRRGQDKITGIVILRVNSRRMNHLVTMVDGRLYDRFYPYGVSLAQYRADRPTLKISIRLLYVKVSQ